MMNVIHIHKKRLFLIALLLPTLVTMCVLLYFLGGALRTQETVHHDHFNSRDLQSNLKFHPNDHTKEMKRLLSKSVSKPILSSQNVINKPIYRLNKQSEGKTAVDNSKWHDNDIPDEYKSNDVYDDYDENDEEDKGEPNKKADDDENALVIEDTDDENDAEDGVNDNGDYAFYNPEFQPGDFDVMNKTKRNNASTANVHIQYLQQKNIKEQPDSDGHRKLNSSDDKVLKPNGADDETKQNIAKDRMLKIDKTSSLDARTNIKRNLQENVRNLHNRQLKNSQMQVSDSIKKPGHSSHSVLTNHQRALTYPGTQLEPPLQWSIHENEVRNYGGIPIIVDKIYWSQQVENLVPKGCNDTETVAYLKRIRKLDVVEVQAPAWQKCGREKNKYILFQDGSSVCARYRYPHSKLIYGEMLSFHLACYLGLDNIPAVALMGANSNASQWQPDKLQNTGWDKRATVALIQWINHLNLPRSDVRIPPVILAAYLNKSTLDWHSEQLQQLPLYSVANILQWSDLILFDYITGHYDRIASVQDAAVREKDPSMIKDKIRNLRQNPANGKLWLIDNESGLFDGYELLYLGQKMGMNFLTFHKQMLQTFCIFKRKTIDKIRLLLSLPSPHQVLLDYAYQMEPLVPQINNIPQYHLFVKYFKQRLKEVTEWIKDCEHR